MSFKLKLKHKQHLDRTKRRSVGLLLQIDGSTKASRQEKGWWFEEMNKFSMAVVESRGVK